MPVGLSIPVRPLRTRKAVGLPRRVDADRRAGGESYGTRMLNVPFAVIDPVAPNRALNVPSNAPCTRPPANEVNVTVPPPGAVDHSLAVGFRESFVSMYAIVQTSPGPGSVPPASGPAAHV